MSKRENTVQRAFKEDGLHKTHVGGQALIEGVMMRGKYNWAAAVREPNGSIHIEEHDLTSGKAKNGWLYWPIVRGCRAFVESLVLGFKALEVAAMHAYADSEEPESEKQGKALAASDSDSATCEGPQELGAKTAEAQEALVSEAHSAAKQHPAAEQSSAAVLCEPDAQNKDAACCDEGEEESFEFGHREMVISMVAGLVLGVGLFVVLPAVIANLLVGEYDSNALAWNVVDGIVRVAIFVFYIWLIGRMQDIKRMFAYHGAEHKTIHCFEHGLPLTPENARAFPCLHVRCGTAFLIMVMIIAIFVYTITPLNSLIAAWGVPDGPLKLLLVIAVRIALMPVIAGISYEITVKWAGSHPDNVLVKVILWPGMQMQRLTTREPDDSQIECAIAAMKAVLEREEAQKASSAA